jgi:hypothetical protein
MSSVNSYFRFFQVSNDGQAILALSDYSNLAPGNVTSGQVLFAIYRDGKLIQSVPVGALFNGSTMLPRTASHFSWGQFEQIDADDNAVFSLDDGRKVLYSLKTGLRVER